MYVNRGKWLIPRKYVRATVDPPAKPHSINILLAGREVEYGIPERSFHKS